jgi:hypothetical protein
MPRARSHICHHRRANCSQLRFLNLKLGTKCWAYHCGYRLYEYLYPCVVSGYSNQDSRQTVWPFPAACIEAREDIWNRLKAMRPNNAWELSPGFYFLFANDQYARPKERVV